MNRANVLMIFLAIVASISQGTNIYISNATDVESISGTKLKDKIEELREDNIELEAEVLSLSSYVNLSSRAAELGLVENKSFVSLFDPVKVAVRR